MQMLREFRDRLERETRALEAAGLMKRERIIGSAQGPVVKLADGREMINLCANNYLGLANHPAVLKAAHDALSSFGYGVASVRFICGTQSVHRQLEERLSAYLGMEDTILYSSCFDANGGLFETLLDAEDAVISDALNHASIIDGIRLCKARRLRYANNDMNELERALKDSQDARVRLIATDGVFSMDGSIAKLGEICDLAERYGALVMVDDSHATGFIGARGRGSHELRGVMDRVDIMTGTLGKALGGASGGYVAARKEIVGWLRQRSRPYLFSNSIAPPVAAATLQVLDLLEGSPELRDRVHANARYFREQMQNLGYDLLPGEHPIVPVMLGEAPLAVAARRTHAGRRRVRGRVRLPGRAPWKGADSHAIERGAFDRDRSTRRSRRSPARAANWASFDKDDYESAGQGSRRARNLDAGRARTFRRTQ